MTSLWALMFRSCAPCWKCHRHVNYPTQVIGKSCKLVPVLLANVFIFGKKESLFKWAQVILVTAGVTMFSMVDSGKKGAQQNSTYGLLLLVGSLAMDGLTGPNQKRVSQASVPLPTPKHCHHHCRARLLTVIVILFAASGHTHPLPRIHT